MLVYTVVRRGLFLFSWLFPRESGFWEGKSVRTNPLQREPDPSSSDPWHLVRCCQPAKAAGFVSVQPVVNQFSRISRPGTTGVCPTSGLTHQSCVGRPLCRRAKSRSLESAGPSRPVIWSAGSHLVTPGNTSGDCFLHRTSLIKISLAGQGPTPVPCLSRDVRGMWGKGTGG